VLEKNGNYGRLSRQDTEGGKITGLKKWNGINKAKVKLLEFGCKANRGQPYARGICLHSQIMMQ
jgi:hypothetical protein